MNKIKMNNKSTLYCRKVKTDFNQMKEHRERESVEKIKNSIDLLIKKAKNGLGSAYTGKLKN